MVFKSVEIDEIIKRESIEKRPGSSGSRIILILDPVGPGSSPKVSQHAQIG